MDQNAGPRDLLRSLGLFVRTKSLQSLLLLRIDPKIY